MIRTKHFTSSLEHPSSPIDVSGLIDRLILKLCPTSFFTFSKPLNPLVGWGKIVKCLVRTCSMWIGKAQTFGVLLRLLLFSLGAGFQSNRQLQ